MKKNIIISIALSVFIIGLCVLLYPQKKEQIENVEIVIPKLEKQEQPIKKIIPKEKQSASFDVVRVEKDGSMVAAGKANSDEQITIMDGETPLAKIDVNEDGEWIFIPDQPLPAGLHELWIKDSSDNNREESEIVVVDVPEQTSDDEAVAVMVSATKDPNILQAPVPEIISDIDITSVHFNKNTFTVKGSTLSNGNINVYADNLFLGKVFAKNKNWELKVQRKLNENQKYLIRADKTDEFGKVIARIEVPFEMEKGLDKNKRKRIKIIKGDCLWSIAENVYGKGEAYLSIYQANKLQIKNPNLIYPNQIFVIPTK